MNAESLSRDQLVDIVKTLQAQLYLGETGSEDNETVVEIWDPDHEWSGADICGAMAAKLSEYGLRPEFLGDKPRL